MEELLRNNKGLVWLAVRRYAGVCRINHACDVDDLRQAGCVGLIKAARTYDASAGATWATWAGLYIASEIRRALGIASGRELRVLLSLDAPAYAEDPEGDTLCDTIPDESIEPFDAEPYRQHVRSQIERALRSMPAPCAEALRLTQLEGRTQAQAAQAMGVDRDELRRLIAKGKRCLFNDKQLRALALDEATPFHKHKGVKAFFSSRSSAVEDAVMRRESLRDCI